MPPASLAPLRALLARCEQLEEQASRALGEAIGAHERALAAVASAAGVLASRNAAVEDARRRARKAADRGSTALAMADHGRFVARRRDERLASREVDIAAHAATERAADVSRARDALARAKGDRDAVARRIEAALAEARRVAEIKTEDEAGDRVGAANVARRTDRHT